MKIKIKSNEPLYLENKGFLVYLVGVIDAAGQESEYLAYVCAELIEEVDSTNNPSKRKSCLIEVGGSFKHLDGVAQAILDSYICYPNYVIFKPHKSPVAILETQYRHDPMITERVKFHGFWHESFLNDREVAIWF